MPQVRIPNWIQTRIQFSVLQQQIEFTANWRSLNPGLWTQAELRALNVALGTAINPRLLTMITTGTTLSQFVTTDLNPGGVTQDLWPLNIAGQLVSDIEPLNVTLVLTLKTGGIGRSRRGRMYMPPTGEDRFQAGVASSAYLAQVLGLGNDLLSFTNAGGRPVKLCVASRKLLSLFDVTAVSANNIPDSQRRRLQGRGR